MSSGAEPSARLPRADPAGELRAAGHFEAAAALLDERIEREARRGVGPRLALAKLARGVVAHDQGDLAGSAELLLEARRLLVAGQQPEAVAVCAFDLALVHQDLGQLDDAVERLLEARAIFESIGATLEAAGCNQNLGVVLHAMGRAGEARSRLLAARAAFAAAGRSDDVAECDHDLAVVGEGPPSEPVRRWAGGFALSPS
jgi:tetratricopeptide (TPR) repeat protein